ncbi:MAG: tetratricopeptide repeat protein [Planctomycetota bacterium]|jgi:serine/threonine protein kinase/Flp pilus assembly protein TadD
MIDLNWDEAKRIFTDAVGLSAEERATYVADACAADDALRSRVDALLRAHERASDFMSAPTEGGSRLPDDPGSLAGEVRGDMIDRYELLQLIGEGGFGSVWMARQHEPVQRTVALKIIKLGMDTRQVIARFEAERQALAMMDHPNIARVLDAGATDQGRPYFVMELVRGVSITEYCDTHNLSTHERIGLFAEVCHAIHHAHQKGIIHRDIKPGNVLVTVHEGRPVPKVIDFGIAKAIHQRLTEKTLFTEYHQFIGTPQYMSPEQAERSGLDVDTRSDSYSLGVLLYELLTGTTPFDAKRLRAAALGEMLRLIREAEPPRPSTRLSTIGEDLPQVATRRGTNPERLSRLLRGDLDWIVMKALEKDRTRRYESASQFGHDIERYLRDEPVVAGPPGPLYRAQKLVRRHRVAVATTAAFALVVVLGIVGTSAMAVWALGERSDAQRQHRIAELVNEFLNDDLLAQADPMHHPDREVTLRAILDRASVRVDGRFEEEPIVEAGVRMTLGRTYRNLGEYDESERHFVQAQRLRRAVLGPDHVETLRASRALVDLHWEAGRADQAEADAVALLERHEALLGRDDLDTAGAMESLSIIYKSQGRYDEAEPLTEGVLEIRRRHLGADDRLTLTAMNNLGTLYRHQGRFEEAETIWIETLERRRRTLGPDDLETVGSLGNLALIRQQQGRYEETEPMCRKVVEVRRRVLGDEHPATLDALNNIGFLYSRMERYEDALPLYREVLAVRRRVLSDAHASTLLSMNNLGYVYMQMGRYDDAEPLLREMLDGTRDLLGTDHPDYAFSLSTMGSLHEKRGRLMEAEYTYTQMMDAFRRTLPEDHPAIGVGLMKHGRCLSKLGRYDE